MYIWSPKTENRQLFGFNASFWHKYRLHSVMSAEKCHHKSLFHYVMLCWSVHQGRCVLQKLQLLQSHWFPWSLAPGNDRTTLVTVETLQCKRKRNPLMGEAKTAKRGSARKPWHNMSERTKINLMESVLVLCQSLLPSADTCSLLQGPLKTDQNHLILSTRPVSNKNPPTH